MYVQIVGRMKSCGTLPIQQQVAVCAVAKPKWNDLFAIALLAVGERYNYALMLVSET